jgi:Protein of unknown function (DUF2946)
MGAIRRHRTLFAWIATVAVLCNLAAGLSSPALARSAGSDPWPVELLGPQVICSGSEHGDRAASPDGNDRTAALHCSMCLAAPGFALIVAPGAALLVPAPIAAERFALQFRDVLTNRLRRAGLGSRAPPLSL